MNTINLYSVLDRKTGVYSPPSCFTNLDEAKRSYALLLRNNPKSMYACFPEDFSVYFVGSMNLSTGEIDVSPASVCVFDLSSFGEASKV